MGWDARRPQLLSTGLLSYLYLSKGTVPLWYTQMHRSAPWNFHFPKKGKETPIPLHNSQLAQWKFLWEQNKSRNTGGHCQWTGTYVSTQVTHTGLCHSLGVACYNYLKTEGSCSTAISCMSGEESASSGSPTCIGYAHPTRAAQNSLELILAMVVQTLQQASRGWSSNFQHHLAQGKMR